MAIDQRVTRSGVTIVRKPGAAQRNPQQHRRRRRTVEIALGIGVPATLLVLWQMASTQGWINERLYPAPSDIVTEGREMWRDGDLWENLWISTQRVLKGYVLGAVTGLAVGLITGTSRVARAALEPLLNALYTVPKLALLPVFLTIFGFAEAPKIALIATTVFFFVWISTSTAYFAVEDGYREAARSFGVSRSQMFAHVLTPAALPQIFVGLRIAAGVTVLMLIGVELVIGDDGLGYLIERGRTLNLLSQTYVGIVLSALLGLVFMYLVRAIGWMCTPWARNYSDDTAAPAGIY